MCTPAELSVLRDCGWSNAARVLKVTAANDVGDPIDVTRSNNIRPAIPQEKGRGALGLRKSQYPSIEPNVLEYFRGYGHIAVLRKAY